MQKGGGGGRRRRGEGHQMACPETAIFGLFWRSGEESPGNFFWLNPITLVPASLPNHKIVKKQPRVDANPECFLIYIVPWLRLFKAIGGFKGRKQPRQAGNVLNAALIKIKCFTMSIQQTELIISSSLPAKISLNR